MQTHTPENQTTIIKTFPDSYDPSSIRLIVTPSAFARAHFLYVQEAGFLRLRRVKHFTQREGLQSYLLVHVQAGRGSLHYSGKRYALQAGQCFFIDCRKPHMYQSDADAPWALQWVHFHGKEAAAYYGLFTARHPAVFTPVGAAQVGGLLQGLLDANRAQGIDTEIENMRLLVGLLAQVLRPQELMASAGRVQPVRAYLREHFAEECTLDALAERFFMSKYSLSHAFKQQYGETVVQYLLHKRITYAKELLRFTDDTVAQIAESCGFHEPSYFNRQFKKAEGISASAYRTQWRGKRV